MNIENFRSKYSFSCVAVLSTLYHDVSRLKEQFQKEKSGEIFKINTLMEIVNRYVWCPSAEEVVWQGKLKSQGLYIKPSASFAISENEVWGSGRDPK